MTSANGKTGRDELDELIEELAAVEHERWAHWQQYMHEHGKRQLDGTLIIPAELVKRWDAQIHTKYADLSKQEKESDREQVQKYLPILKKWIERGE